MTRAEKLRKLGNAVREYRGVYLPHTGKWVRPPNQGKAKNILYWLDRLGVPEADRGWALKDIQEFKSYDEFRAWMRTADAAFELIERRKQTGAAAVPRPPKVNGPKDVICPECNAQPGAGCRGFSGMFHPRRAHMAEKAAKLIAGLGAVEEGFGGVLPNGNIVDRRERPEAMPLQENSLLGIPKPKKA